MTQDSRPEKPKLLEIRWVCSICLKVIYKSLEVSWVWCCDHQTVRHRDSDHWHYWQPINVEGPRCHGLSMLILGEPKEDVHGLRGHGLTIDPLDDMRCPRAMVA